MVFLFYYIDYMALRCLVSTKPIHGKMISIRKVPKPTSILVIGITEKVTKEFLELYFENDRYGGGEVKAEYFGSGYAVVKFHQADG